MLQQSPLQETFATALLGLSPNAPFRLNRARSASASTTLDALKLPGAFDLSAPLNTGDNVQQHEKPQALEFLFTKRRRRKEEEQAARDRRFWQAGRAPPPTQFPASFLYSAEKLVTLLSPPISQSGRPKRPALDVRMSQMQASLSGAEMARRALKRTHTFPAHFSRTNLKRKSTTDLRSSPPPLVGLRPASLLDLEMPSESVNIPGSDSSSSTAGEPQDYFSIPKQSFPSHTPRLLKTLHAVTPPPLTQFPIVQTIKKVSQYAPASLSFAFEHLFGFCIFLFVHAFYTATHLTFLTYSTCIFLYYVHLHLRGRTELSRVIKEQFIYCRTEWRKVEKAENYSLSWTQIILGLVELSAIQSLTHQKYLEEGNGQLFLIGNLSRGASGIESVKSGEEDDLTEGDVLLISSKDGDIAEATIVSPQLRATSSDDVEEIVSPISLGPGVLTQALYEEPQNLKTASNADDGLQPDLKAMLKRCCRFATATYGLQAFILQPPTPLFTPSGLSMTAGVFAHLSKLQDKDSVLHCALQQPYSAIEQADNSWQPTFYVIRDLEHRQIVVIFRGTQSLHDIVIDLSTALATLTLTHEDGTSHDYLCHGGILQSARNLLKPTSALFQKIRTALIDHPGFSLVLTGHSLGAGLAVVCSILLSQYSKEANAWTIVPETGLPDGHSIQAIGFATPPFVDAMLAKRCAIGMPPLVCSVTIGADMVVRLAISQIRDLRRILSKLARSPSSFSLLGALLPWLPFISEEEQIKAAWQRRSLVDQLDAVGSFQLIPAGQAFHVEFSQFSAGESKVNVYGVRDPAEFYRAPWLVPNCFTHHLPVVYLDCMQAMMADDSVVSYQSINSLLRDGNIVSKKPSGFLQTPTSPVMPRELDTRLSTFRLIALVCSILGATLVWAVEYGYASNYLIALGLSKQATSLVWLAGPISGLICQPIIGSISDADVGRFRRRKYIALSCAAVCISALFVAYCRGIAALIVPLFAPTEGDWDPRNSEWVRSATLWIVIPAFWVLDFALNALQAVSRALILDTASGKEQTVANAWQGRVSQVGNLLGFSLGFTDLGHSKALSWLPGGQTAHLLVVSITLCVLFTSITCYFIDEEDTDDDLDIDQDISPLAILRNVKDNFIQLPVPIRQICYVQFFSWVGWFPFMFYATVYIAEQSQHERSKPRDVAERDGSLAMLYYALVGVTAGTVLPFLYHFGSSSLILHASPKYNLVKRLFRLITLRNLWLLSSLLFSLLMFSTLFITTLSSSFVVIALVGINNAITTWIPFSLIMEMVIDLNTPSSKLTSPNLDRDTALPSNGKRMVNASLTECAPLLDLEGRSQTSQAGATILGNNLAIVAPQLITSLIASFIFKIADTSSQSPSARPPSPRTDVAYVFALGGASSLIAALLTLKVPPTSSEEEYVEQLNQAIGPECESETDSD